MTKLTLLATLPLLLLTACDTSEPTTPATPPAAAPAAPAAPAYGTAAPTAAPSTRPAIPNIVHGSSNAPAAPLAERTDTEHLSFQLPAGWTMTPATGMRFATITTPDGVEVSVTRFPGTTGGTLANVNRWRSQVNQPPLTEEQLHTVTMDLPIGNTTATFTMLGDHSSETAPRIVAAIVPAGELTYFFKMMGPKPQLANHEQTFINMVKSIRVK
jgi:hypothetical protein